MIRFDRPFIEFKLKVTNNLISTLVDQIHKEVTLENNEFNPDYDSDKVDYCNTELERLSKNKNTYQKILAECFPD